MSLTCLQLDLLGLKNRPQGIRLPWRQGLDGQAGIEPWRSFVGHPAHQPVPVAGQFVGGVQQARNLAGVVRDQPAQGLVQGQLAACEPWRFGREVHPGSGRTRHLIKHGERG